MPSPVFLTVEEVLAIHEDQIARYGGSTGVRDIGLVESAVSTPTASYFGELVHKDLAEIAAAYLFYLVKNHAFIDGNKRVGAAAADVFLDMNGFELRNEEPAFSDLVLAVARGEADKLAVTEFIRTHIQPLEE
jgi:death-on-curing protein